MTSSRSPRRNSWTDVRCSPADSTFKVLVRSVDSDGVDEYVVLNLLDALVRKSLLIADRSAGRMRFSMLETIREFAGKQLEVSGVAEEVRDAHGRHFADRESSVMTLWDSPQQREAYAWFGTELANLRVAFRWAAERGDLDVAANIATYAGILGYLVENLEPIGWAEELIEAARAVDHPRLATLYVLASECGLAGRIDDAVRYRHGAMEVMARGGEVLFGFECLLGRMYLLTGNPEQWANWCRPNRTRVRHPRTPSRVVRPYRNGGRSAR